MGKVHPPGYCLFHRGYGNLLLRLQNPAYSSLGTIYSPQTPRSSSFNMSHRLSQPWTTRRMPSEMRPSLTSDWSLHNPVKLERALTSSSACKNMDTNPPPQSATILPLRSSAQELRSGVPLRSSAWSALQIQSPSSGPRPSKWAQLDLDFPQKTLGCTLSSLSEPQPCTLRGSHIGLS